jgi:LAS superfamily LD-carboxypeptidase LdcB
MRILLIVIIVWGASLNIQARSLHIGTTHVAQTDSLKPYTAEELLGQFEPATHPGFIKVSSSVSSKPNLYLRREAYDAFISMHKIAARDGIQLTIISATRNFNYQKSIWERKWSQEKYKGRSDADKAKDILKYSSMPGCSRHHWGTDIDINNLEPSYFKQGAGKKEYDWLCANAATFGFYQTYTSKVNGRQGYEEEAWHWSYMPLAKPMLEQFNKTISYEMFTGFKGCEQASAMRVIEVFVNGIDDSLKK